MKIRLTVIYSLLFNNSSKNQNPREGIENLSLLFLISYAIIIISSKNQNPREGIENEAAAPPHPGRGGAASKNQNPREGIENSQPSSVPRNSTISLQKTKIPARGLKKMYSPPLAAPGTHLQKTKIPARGLKSCVDVVERVELLRAWLQKTKIPARGLKSALSASPPRWKWRLQKTKIPARGLKNRLSGQPLSLLFFVSSKNQNPREGIENKNLRGSFVAAPQTKLQKTKIPARGLKIEVTKDKVTAKKGETSKNQNPREGIENRSRFVSKPT